MIPVIIMIGYTNVKVVPIIPCTVILMRPSLYSAPKPYTKLAINIMLPQIICTHICHYHLCFKYLAVANSMKPRTPHVTHIIQPWIRKYLFVTFELFHKILLFLSKRVNWSYSPIYSRSRSCRSLCYNKILLTKESLTLERSVLSK